MGFSGAEYSRESFRDSGRCTSIDGWPKPLAQVKQLRAAGAAKVFNETESGAKTDRIQLCRALDQLANGDVLIVMRSRRFRARQWLFTPEGWKIF